VNYPHIEELIGRHPELAGLAIDLEKVCNLIIEAYHNSSKVLVCGNGGSCSDAGHIVGELMKGFHKKRPLPLELKDRIVQFGSLDLANKLQTSLRAVDLTAMTALNTAVANDINPEYVFAQQVTGFADPGDVFIGISTSGNSKSVHFAAIAAKAAGAVLIGLTGSDGGIMQKCALYDEVVCVPESITYRIQEEHIAIYHAICATVEEAFFVE